MDEFVRYFPFLEKLSSITAPIEPGKMKLFDTYIQP
jgi:hypothetical protein